MLWGSIQWRLIFIIHIPEIESNRHYTRGFSPKRVTSGGVHLLDLAPGQHSSEETSQRWRAVGGTVPIWPTRESSLWPSAPLACARSNWANSFAENVESKYHKQKIPSPVFIALSKCRSHKLHWWDLIARNCDHCLQFRVNAVLLSLNLPEDYFPAPGCCDHAFSCLFFFKYSPPICIP